MLGLLYSSQTHTQELICQHAWNMLSPEDRAECMSHLPSFDVVTDDDAVQDMDGIVALKLVDGFFEKNGSLQDDMRGFQVSSIIKQSLCSQSDLGTGRFQSTFLKRAANARKKRLRGDFDIWKARLTLQALLTPGRPIRTLVGPKSEIKL
jgi:hypothetical protein